MKCTAIIMIALLPFFSCTGSNNELNEKDKDQYEQGKMSLEEIEKKDPVTFLVVKAHDKKNLVGQTVIKGKITNKAKIVTYKDIGIELTFFSKTKALLEKDQETVFETVPPGKTVDFKTKYFAPRETDSVSIRITSAKF